MILWDRIKQNLDDGIDIVQQVSRRLSERARIEAAVARLLIDKGSLDTKASRLQARLGARVSSLWEQKAEGIMTDPEVIEALKEISDVKEKIEALRLKVQKASLGEEED